MFVFPDCYDLGRYQLGQRVPLTLCTYAGDGVPRAPDAAPYADLYMGLPGFSLVETVRLSPVERYQATGVFRNYLFLGSKYAAAFDEDTQQLWVVYRYTFSTVAHQQRATFRLVAGGDAAGGAVALREYTKPEARYILQHANDGLEYGRNPTV